MQPVRVLGDEERAVNSAHRIVIGLLLLIAAGCGAVVAEPARGPMPSQTTATNDSPPKTVDWPAFRGPHRNGISTEQNWLTKWPADGPKRLWTANVGLGYSSIAVADGRAYTLGNRDGSETVYCFDAETGRELWKHSYACGLIDYLHLGGPGATPTVDGDTVYTLSKEGHLHALDAATGKVRWLVNLPKDLGVPTLEWGFTSSPLVHGNLLIIDVAGLAAFDKATGKVAWRSGTYRVGYGSPVFFDGGTREQLVTALTNDCLVVVRAADGREIAKYDWTSQYTTSGTTPVVSGRKIFISTGYGTGCALLEFVGGKLVEVYRNEEMSNHMCTSVLWQGRLYGIDGNSHTARQCKLVCLDFETGKRLWEERGFGCASLMSAAGKLLILGDEGALHVAEATPEGYVELAKTQAFEAHTWTMPVLANGRIYCRSESGDVVCLDVRP